MAKNNAKLPNIDALIRMGINPETGLPFKMSGVSPKTLKGNIRTVLRIIDEQDAVNRTKWFNIPCTLSSQELERMVYYKFQVCMFYLKELEEFFILPFTLASDKADALDVFGRYKYIRPIPFVASSLEDDKKTPIEVLLSSLCLKVVYAPILPEDLKEEDFSNCAVILQDYTPQYNQTNGICRQAVNEPILDVMAECVPLLRTYLMSNSGLKGVRVNDADQAEEVKEATKQVQDSALTGDFWIPMVGMNEFQELTNNGSGKSEEYMLAMQSLDNLRLSTYGIDNGGLFEKKAHELQSEADINGGPVGLVMQDAISIRQKFCTICNSIWNLGIWCEPSETISKADMNGDGVLYDENEGNNSGVEGGNENV